MTRYDIGDECTEPVYQVPKKDHLRAVYRVLSYFEGYSWPENIIQSRRLFISGNCLFIQTM